MKNNNYKTIFIDIMLGDRFLFTMPYKYCPLFKINIQDIYKKVIDKRPSLFNKEITLYVDDVKLTIK